MASKMFITALCEQKITVLGRNADFQQQNLVALTDQHTLCVFE